MRSVYDVDDMFTVSNQISMQQARILLFDKIFPGLAFMSTPPNTIALKVHRNAMQILCKD